eukprot:3681083-Rhodomonas_salina.2
MGQEDQDVEGDSAGRPSVKRPPNTVHARNGRMPSVLPTQKSVSTGSGSRSLLEYRHDCVASCKRDHRRTAVRHAQTARQKGARITLISFPTAHSPPSMK